MPNRDRYPAGVPCWVATAQPDAQAAADFYRGLFGWELENRMPADAPGVYFEARLDGGTVAAVGSQSEAGVSAWTTYIAVDDADAIAERVRAAGGTVVSGPFDVFDA